MKRTIIQPADLSLDALTQCKQWLGISQSGEDALLEQLLHSSVDLCEAFIRQLPIECGCEQTLPALQGWQCLDSFPVRAITSVSTIAGDGSRTPLISTDFEVEIDADGTGKVRLLNLLDDKRIAVGFVAGITPDWTQLPDGLRHGILRTAALLYRDRDSSGGDTLPASISTLWLPWRRTRLA